MDLNTIKYAEKEIAEKRKLIRKELFLQSINIKCGVIEKISEKDIKILFELYDKYFFDCFFKRSFKNKISFTLSNRMTSAAGKTFFYRKRVNGEVINEYEIRMAVKFFFQYYDLSREKAVCGIKTIDSVEAFFIVFEHELCHLIEFYYYDESSCKKDRFKKIAHDLFGHTDVFHQLPTNKEIVYDLHGIKVGSKVKFESDGYIKEGFVHRINKRATVMVVDKKGTFIDNKNIRYNKWYVPLNKLIKQ